MFSNLEQILISCAEHMHLALFAPAASFIEEIIPPIPSPAVMIITGSMAKVQEYVLPGIIILIILGALGKNLGASVAYYISDKVEDVFAGKITKFIGITHEQIEAFGARLSRSWKDYFVLILLRALPIIPSTLLSVGGGLLKIDFKLFIISTFIGSLIRDSIYVFLGYAAAATFVRVFVKNASGIESFIQAAVVIIVFAFLINLYLKRQKAKK